MNPLTENLERASISRILLGKIPVSGIRFWKYGLLGRKSIETWIPFQQLDAGVQGDSK
jgi:hypothetical protein